MQLAAGCCHYSAVHRKTVVVAPVALLLTIRVRLWCPSLYAEKGSKGCCDRVGVVTKVTTTVVACLPEPRRNGSSDGSPKRVARELDAWSDGLDIVVGYLIGPRAQYFLRRIFPSEDLKFEIFSTAQLSQVTGYLINCSALSEDHTPTHPGIKHNKKIQMMHLIIILEYLYNMSVRSTILVRPERNGG